MFSTRILPLGRFVLRNTQMRSKSKFTVECKIENFINSDLEKEVYKPKDHPGRVRFGGPIEIPDRIHKSIENKTDDNKIKKYIEEGKKLDSYLFSRHVNLEQKDIFGKRKEIQRQLQADEQIQKKSSLQKGELISEETQAKARKELSAKVNTIFYKHNYNWKPIEYDELNAWAYLYGRAAKEYATILKVFGEIAKRDPEFKPRSFFDFGAGVGTGTWAASEVWQKSIFEYFCVDKSAEMNDLADLIIRGAKGDKKNIFYRQYLPASGETKYHIVLSAFSLMESENLEERLEILNTLWKKCDGYFVVIENGTNAGFQLVEEARTLILSQKDFESEAYLFSPCPHEKPCPRVLANDGTPCNFEVCYHPLRIGNLRSSNDGKARFSYVVFKKGSRSDDATIDWPRLVRRTQVRGRHTRCHMCTHQGELREIILTKEKHSKFTYRCAKKSDVGDRMPLVFEKDALVPLDMEIPDDEKFE